MKSFWISSVIRSAVIALAALLTVVGTIPDALAAKRKMQSAGELTNIFVSPEYSQWLVGPVARMATGEEIEAFLAIRSDADAAEFIGRFWEERDRDVVWPAQMKSEIFDERAAEADAFYSEGAHLGRRTDRGTIYILYGKPSETRFEVRPRGPKRTIEIWGYGGQVGYGLDGERPKRSYSFWKDGELTVFYLGPVPRRLYRN